MNTYAIEVVLAREKNGRVAAKERWSFTVDPVAVVKVEVELPKDLPTLADTQMLTVDKTQVVGEKRKEEFLRALKSWVFKESPSILNNVPEWSVLGALQSDTPIGNLFDGTSELVVEFLTKEPFTAVWGMTPYSFTEEDQKRWQRHYLVDSV